MEKISLVSLKLYKEKSIPYFKNQITDPKKAFRIIKDFIGNMDREVLGTIMLNSAKEVNAIEIVSIGTLNATLVSPREIFKGAILSNADSIMIFHTHPSGNVEPSQADLDVTTMLNKVASIIGINLIDHIIVGDDRYYSLATEGYEFGSDIYNQQIEI
ncbi:JAB domain-containing protein [[Clostridium] spiroforme]|nr:JAB domain-containing protein [Thomasclavelia spiroformis]